jgi:hypothetical protein
VPITYLRRLLDNPRVLRYLAQHYPEIQAEIQKLAEPRSAADGVAAKPAAE